MSRSWSDFGIRDTINWLGSYPSSPVLEPEKAEDITPPIQLDQSVNDYFKMIKIYATELGVDLDNQGLKEKFFNGLSLENKIEAIRFGIKKPIKEIVKHIENIGNDPVMKYFACNKLFGYNKEQLRYQFLRGLSYDNQLEVRRCGLELPLEELVERLSAIENIRKMCSICT
ncbi:hypothetical protein Glove_74g88 [Diversispora epigaea]|uniref:Uncharacterized protein n=1 Tax=Diversispora epigaea TaxID=1348612 RepID=A0A397J919_9GLOM|nr:hypothetical protein Glove_74g88 [Diversispora epigaea]